MMLNTWQVKWLLGGRDANVSLLKDGASFDPYPLSIQQKSLVFLANGMKSQLC